MFANPVPGGRLPGENCRDRTDAHNLASYARVVPFPVIACSEVADRWNSAGQQPFKNGSIEIVGHVTRIAYHGFFSRCSANNNHRFPHHATG
jgi:hypothetical protein